MRDVRLRPDRWLLARCRARPMRKRQRSLAGSSHEQNLIPRILAGELRVFSG